MSSSISQIYMYLPTEIILQIVYFVATSIPEPQRQWTLHACCLTSRQWYSVAIPFLYENPQLSAETAFSGFEDTVCPPIHTRKNKLNPGRFVRRLDLCHRRTIGLTTTLLDRVKESLEVFVAPRLSFPENSLFALSRCRNLRSLDLSLVDCSIQITEVVEALGTLENLTTLYLPRHGLNIPPTPTATADMSWLDSLQEIQVSGLFSDSALSTISWPHNLSAMTLVECDDLFVETLAFMLNSPNLGWSLKRLTISKFNDCLVPGCIEIIPSVLPALEFLSIPGDVVENSFFEILAEMTTTWALRTLELDYRTEEASCNFEAYWLNQALRGGLAKLRSLGLSVGFNGCRRGAVVEEDGLDGINAILLERAKNENVIGDSSNADGAVDFGIYYF